MPTAFGEQKVRELRHERARLDRRPLLKTGGPARKFGTLKVHVSRFSKTTDSGEERFD